MVQYCLNLAILDHSLSRIDPAGIVAGVIHLIYKIINHPSDLQALETHFSVDGHRILEISSKMSGVLINPP